MRADATPTHLPRSTSAERRQPRRGHGSFELYAWVFMRVSGVLLVLLVLSHFAIMHVVDGGISRVNFAFVSGRWSNPFWRVYDFAMVTLALLHGGNGLRVIIDDYARSGARRLAYQTLNATVVGLTWVLGSLTIFTFTPGA
ncbi:MAG TPA: succinate dehydrogenase hydrophobic membrane anchor subunit [Actinomycetes bacterium]|jgi:succinate dehydrogenase / fumarate reductase membrane anchor subunit|nr:succinate dehydrogenase hydrophobic membrane anchor subunit [Actinomycetes bacterium]